MLTVELDVDGVWCQVEPGRQISSHLMSFRSYTDTDGEPTALHNH